MRYRKENKFTGSFLYIQGNSEEDEEIAFDVTGLISFASVYKEKGFSKKVLKGLLSSISNDGKRLEEDGKDMNSWLLNPDLIYVSANREGHVMIFYYPGKTNLIMERELMHLAEFVIEHVDYKDRDAVEIAYDFYMRVHRGNYVFEDLIL